MKYVEYENWNEYAYAYAENFTLEESYIICGIGDGFDAILDIFPQLKIELCLDIRANNLAKISKRGYQAYPYEILSERDTSSQKCIITAGCEYYAEIKRTLLHYGVLEKHISSMQELLFFWGARYYKKTFSNACNIILLTNCNLRCKSCLQLVPYIKKHRYFSVNEIKASLDQYFRIFDYVKELNPIGGETMLYKELGQVFAYIKRYYSDRYYELIVITNGLITPEETVIEELSKLKRVRVMISDYTRSGIKTADTLIHYLKKHNVRYELNNNFTQSTECRWFNLGDPTLRKDGDAEARFRKCSLVCQSLVGHRIYYCGPSTSSVVGEIVKMERPELILDLDDLEKLSKQEQQERIGKFNLGFLDRGQLEFCAFCNGFGTDINTNFTPAGEQLPHKTYRSIE